jgi:hypothetical protein
MQRCKYFPSTWLLHVRLVLDRVVGAVKLDKKLEYGAGGRVGSSRHHTSLTAIGSASRTGR